MSKESISLNQIFKILKNNILLFVSLIIGFTIIVVLLVLAFIKPEYTSKTSLLVDPTKFSSSQSQSGDVSGGIRATGTIADWIIEDMIIDETIKRLANNGYIDEDDYSIRSFKECIDVTNTTTDLYVYVYFKSSNPELSKICLNTLIDVGLEKTDGVIVVDKSYQQISKASKGTYSGKSKIIYLIGGVVLSVFVSFGLVLVKDACKVKFKDDDDVESITGIRVIGRIVNDERGLNSYDSIEDSPNRINYEKLLTNIDFSNIDGKIKKIEFTSPEKADGKSTTVYNLAKTMDNLNRKVLVIDLDLRCPHINKLFKISNKIGVTDYCANKVSQEQIIKKVSDNIDVITSGTIVPNPLLILQSKALGDLINNNMNKYDYILLDCPPYFVSSDAKMCSKLSDGIVFTLSANKTRIKETNNMLRDFKLCNSVVLGINVTRLKIRKRDYYYYSYNEESKQK